MRANDQAIDSNDSRGEDQTFKTVVKTKARHLKVETSDMVMDRLLDSNHSHHRSKLQMMREILATLCPSHLADRT